MQTINVFSRSKRGRRLYETWRVVCLDPEELAFRGFVWKLGLVYADAFLDKSQRWEINVGESVTIAPVVYACLPSGCPDPELTTVTVNEGKVVACCLLP